jgi:hypothetical protein
MSTQNNQTRIAGHHQIGLSQDGERQHGVVVGIAADRCRQRR